MTVTIAERRFLCPACGGALHWQPVRQALACAACGAAEPAPSSPPTVLPEHPLDEGLRAAHAPSAPSERVAYQCGTCRALSYVDQDARAEKCPFCGAGALLPYDAHADPFHPETLIPFAVSEPDARASAQRWIRAQWFAPPVLARRARTGVIRASYVPFWTFDAHALGHWERAGTRGIVNMDFVDVLACADPQEDAALLEALEPWPTRMRRAWDPRYVAGWTVASGTGRLPEASVAAHARMERDLVATAVRNQTAREREKVRLMGIEYTRETFAQTLLPIWRLDYTYLGRPYRIVINGANGTAVGKAPVSAVKIALVAVVALWLYVLAEDSATALAIPAWIARTVTWLVTRPFGGP